MPNQSKVMLICKITEQRKQKLKVEILHDLKNFEKKKFILISFYNNLICLICLKNGLLQNNLALKCQVV